MKKFSFPLHRVLDWRRVQLKLEEAGLDQIHAELRDLQQQQEALDLELTEARRQIRESKNAGGFELTVLDTFSGAVGKNKTRLKQQQAEAHTRLAEKMAAVQKRKRDVKLLEKLQARGLATWTVEAEREITNLAEESFLARWNRR